MITVMKMMTAQQGGRKIRVMPTRPIINKVKAVSRDTAPSNLRLMQ